MRITKLMFVITIVAAVGATMSFAAGSATVGTELGIEARLRELGIELPAASNPAANNANCARSRSSRWDSSR